MRSLIPTFPRHFATPTRYMVKNETEFYKKLNTNNGFNNCYYSLYSLDENGKFDTCQIDKIAFDFDEEDWIQDIKKLSEVLIKEDITHTFIFSGKKGGHFYIATTNYEGVENSKNTLFNAHNYFIKKYNLKADPHITGDVARILRVPNTWHLGGKRYCIPLNKSDLNKSIEEIKEKAVKNNGSLNWYGNKLLDIKQFDLPIPKIEKPFYNIQKTDYNHIIELDDKLVNSFHPCIKQWLYSAVNESEGCNYEQRFIFAIYCSERGIPPNITNTIAKKYFKGKKCSSDRNAYAHFKKVNALKFAYDPDRIMPNCQTLINKGYCKGPCKHFQENNFPLYKK